MLMPKPDQQLRQRITDLADMVEALVRSLSPIGVPRAEIERNRIAVAMERISAAKKASDG